jgi:chemosensory pili system protein ChpA (sensor histidine kinase/response regulator)
MAERDLVIVVDDDLVVVHLIEKILERATVRVAATSSGSGALSLLHENHGEVLLMFVDLAMPGISGIELIRQMRAQPNLADIPVVAVTADFGIETYEHLKEVGVEEIIEKPFRNERLIDVLQRHGVKMAE